MGNSESSESNPNPRRKMTWERFQRTHRKLKTYDDERYGELTIYQEMVMPQIEAFNKPVLKFVKEFWALTAQSEADTEALLHCLKINECDNLMSYLNHFEIEENRFCSSFNKHIIVYEYLGDTLKRTTQRWAKRRTPDGKSRVFIPEPQIWHVVSSVQNALETLKQEPFGISHGDIQPRTIHLSNPEITAVPTSASKIHLYPSPFISPNVRNNSFFAPSHHCGYHKTITSGYKSALSPLLLEAWRNKQVNPEHDPSKSDIFSLGVSLLATCTNQSFENFYDWKNKKFDYARKGKELARMRKIGYSSELVDLIDKMVEESEMRRIDLEGVGIVVDRVDRIGDIGDGLSRAESRSRRSRGSVLGELDFSTQINDLIPSPEVVSGGEQSRPRSRDQVRRNNGPSNKKRGRSANPLRSNYSQSNFQKSRPEQFGSHHQPSTQQKPNPNPLYHSNYIQSNNGNLAPPPNQHRPPSNHQSQHQQQPQYQQAQPNQYQHQQHHQGELNQYQHQQHQQGEPQPTIIIQESPRVINKPHVQPVIRQRPERPPSTSNNFYNNYNPNPHHKINHQPAIQIDGASRQTPRLQYQSQPQSLSQPLQYQQPLVNANIRQGTPPRFHTKRKERISLDNYTCNQVKISKKVEQEPTELEIIEGVNEYGQIVKKRIYTSVNRTIVEEIDQN